MREPLLERAFEALGPRPSFRELELVAAALRNSGDPDTIEALERAGDLDEAFDRIADLAIACGSSGSLRSIS